MIDQRVIPGLLSCNGKPLLRCCVVLRSYVSMNTNFDILLTHPPKPTLPETNIAPENGWLEY